MKTRITPLLDVRNVREAIIHVLSSEFPLTVTQLRIALTRSFALSVSYQAIHKEVCKLLLMNIVVRDERNLYLNPEWINRQKAFFFFAYEKYLGQKELKNVVQECELQMRLDDLID